MSVILTWRGEAFRQNFANATREGIMRASVYYHTACRRAVSVPNSGVRVPVKRRTKGGNKRTRTIYPNPSKPGEPPRLRTGFGQRNIVHEFDPVYPAARVGVRRNAMYMFYLEIGTLRVRRRPWMLPTLQKNQATLGRLAALGARKGMGT